ncbi:MAG: hypothetical protein JWO91_1076 [Acidobacteriaceae bacterium]|nr:hypothetical protein [Acidobacteriaceae bacterium]
MSREGSFTDKSDLPEMTKELETAIALDPKFADSYMLLAFAYSYSGDPAKGLLSMQKAVSLNPRNENYRFNLAQVYLNNQKPDQAIAILRVLRNSSNPEVAQRAAQSLTQAEEFQAAMQAAPAANSVAFQRLSAESAVNGSVQVAKTSTTKDDDVHMLPAQPTPKFLKGTLITVDCSSPPSATLTVLSGAKTWKMQVADSKHILVMGADEFSCAWNKQKVALNYSETGDAAGRVISIEVQ